MRRSSFVLCFFVATALVLLFSVEIFLQLKYSPSVFETAFLHRRHPTQRIETPEMATRSMPSSKGVPAPEADVPSSPACRIRRLLSTEFSLLHSHLSGDSSCSAPLAQHDNQDLHPGVASVCSTPLGSASWKLLKHPENIDYVLNSDQENAVSSVFLPIAATCAGSVPALVIDMGTNEGLYAMASAALGCTVLTLDPQSMCIDIFKRALLSFPENSGFHKRIYALNAAASASSSTMEASIDSCQGCYTTDGSVSCKGSEKHTQEWRRQRMIDSVNVGSVIEALGFSEVLLLHVDTEGHEISVLRGLEARLLSKSIKNIIIETRPLVWGSDDDSWFRSVLQRSGYKCWQLFNSNPYPNIHLLNNVLYYWNTYLHISPSIDLSRPFAECDMFCTVAHSNPYFSQDHKRLLSCKDATANI
jgi:FkbM family methyltransferase